MNQQFTMPDPETRSHSVARWREVNQQIDLVTLQLDELIAMVELGLREQRMFRLQGKAKRQAATEAIKE